MRHICSMGLVLLVLVDCVGNQLLPWGNPARDAGDDGSAWTAGDTCYLFCARRMVGGIRFPHDVGNVQTNSLAHALPRTVFVALLSFSFFPCAFRLGGADLGIAPTLASHAGWQESNMTRAIGTFAAAAFAIASLISAANAQQAGGGSGGGRKHHQQKTDAAASTGVKADDKAYNTTLKSLPNKPFDPWSGTR
jgi:hypothetical protein